MPMDQKHPELSVKQRFAAQQRELKASVNKMAAQANAQRLARNTKVQLKQKADGLAPTQLAVGDVVWIDGAPFKGAGKWDQKVRRSRALIVKRVDTLRRRVQVLDFETRLPRKGWFPTHLLSRVKGGDKVLRQLQHELAHKHELDQVIAEPAEAHIGAQAAAQVEASKKQQKKKKPVQQAVEKETPQQGLAVPCEYGIIVNVTNTVEGFRVLLVDAIAGTQVPDWSQPATEVAEDQLPTAKAAIRKAWQQKHLLQAPAGVRKSARLSMLANTNVGHFDTAEVLRTQQGLGDHRGEVESS
jgi:hypothetical protein